MQRDPNQLVLPAFGPRSSRIVQTSESHPVELLFLLLPLLLPLLLLLLLTLVAAQIHLQPAQAGKVIAMSLESLLTAPACAQQVVRITAGNDPCLMKGTFCLLEEITIKLFYASFCTMMNDASCTNKSTL